MSSKLFSPLTIRGVVLRNRVALSPMLMYQARNGYTNEWHLAHLMKFAVGGVGLVFMESTKIDPRGCSTASDPGIWKDEFIEPLQQITRMIKQYGAVPGIQLGHSGRKARNSLPWKGRKPDATIPGVDHGEEWEIIAPSAVPHNSKYNTPREMTLDDIREQIGFWENATRRADKAGFEVLEVHAAHGYLLHQFLSPSANRREDEYGGPLENRMRFPLEVIRAVRAIWPEEKALFVRVSATDESGGTLEDTVAFARALKQVGVDVVDCSSGGMGASSTTDTGAPPQAGYQVKYAETVREEADIKTMAVGLIVDPLHAEKIVEAGSADIVALGRELLYNPHWVIDAAVKLGVDKPYSIAPESYGYWLEKRDANGFRRA